MGTLSLPASGVVYADAQVFIYSVEKHPTYGPLLRPLWQAVQAGTLEVVSSELALMETLVGPLKKADAVLVADYEQFFQQAGVRLLPITQAVLREAARLRATTRLRTPDALHAATALLAGCVLFLSNDYGFRSVPGLPLVVLQDVAAAP
jgi:predicted nucleic acid-binding protein